MKRVAAFAVLFALLVSPASTAGERGVSTPKPGNVIGTIVIPKLQVRARARGRRRLRAEPRTQPRSVDRPPGAGGTVAIAGHRTTYGAWFRHIDKLAPGDVIELVMRPRYGGGTFRYRVAGHRIVPRDAGRTLVRHIGAERLILTACHPLGSDALRYVVYAYPVRR